MIEMRVEPFASIRHELMPLWAAHWHEVGEDKASVPLDPDWERYGLLEREGHLLIVTARKDRRLVGYAFALISTHLHYRTTRFAHTDLYYVMPACRGGRTAMRLIQALEAELWARGVVKIMTNTKLAFDQGRLLDALGWREAERLYVKARSVA